MKSAHSVVPIRTVSSGGLAGSAALTAPAGPDDAQLLRLAQRVGRRLLGQGRVLVTAESCTGGWVACALTDVPGSSRWFDGGLVTYSNAAKMRDLGVPAGTLKRFGAVSEQTARAMARGALRRTAAPGRAGAKGHDGADVAVTITGIAGPDGGTVAKPVGTVWFCTAVRRGRRIILSSSIKHFRGNREAVRRKSVRHALQLVLLIQ